VWWLRFGCFHGNGIKLGYKGANFYNKLKKDNLTEKELHRIADALDCDYDGIFTFRDTGKQI